MSEITLSDATFKQEVIESKSPVLVDFWAPWCGPCRLIAPMIAELAHDFAGRLKVGKLNVDDNPEVARAFGIMSIPTVMLFKDGKVAEKIIGAMPKEKLLKAVESHLPAAG